ncbi:phage integrase N-terminal SAM-like domain-containing protein [Vibrio maritimus]|uniref:phage integrase N-terminal SAM-like domain-containing protein n=1 Tax=Vibrio maritimus TaxID=990268 RepID=UPI0037357C8C
MSSITYLSGWKPELCIQLLANGNCRADFNRLLVKGIPSSKQLQQEHSFLDAQREDFILQIKSRFEEKIKEGFSHRTLYSYFADISRYLRWCDQSKDIAFTQASLESYMTHLQTRVMHGTLKQTTYGVIRSRMVMLFQQYLDISSQYFDNIVIMDKTDTEPFEAYARSDLNKLLPFLRRLFNQTYSQFIEAPDKHINAHKKAPTMMFEWKDKSYPVYAGISKMMSAATYLLAYYTYANTSDLFQLKQPQNASTSVGEIWYTMPAFKRRAFKTIHIEMGGHELDIPKYAMQFFDKLLKASRLINNDANAVLLQMVVNKKVQPLNSSTAGNLFKWVERHFTFTDQTGRRLRPVVSRFRETGSQLTAFHQGEIVTSLMLNNTPKTRHKHYSKGNKHTNNGMLQDAMSIRQEQIQNSTDTKQAQINLGIDVLVIEAENKVNFPELSRTANGSSCAHPFGEQSKKYTRKAQTHRLLKDGEKLACAELLKCFGCPEQVVVQSVSDIWCLLSFKACIEESLYFHLDAHHYRKNFEVVLSFIDMKILPNISSSTLRQAESKLNNDGSHPSWSDSESVLGLIPRTLKKEQ